MNHHSRIRKDQRVVRACVQFARDHLFDVPQRFLKRAQNLWGTSQRIRILNLRSGINCLRLRAPLMLLDSPRKIRMRPQVIADAPGHLGLAAKTARFLRLFAQHLRLAPKRLKQARRQQFHPMQQPLGFVRRQSR